MITIEKGVLMPPNVQNRANLKKLKDMEVGDSFTVTGEAKYKNMRMFAYRHGIDISARKQKREDGLKEWRLWRVK